MRNEREQDRQRLERLRTLAAELERLPKSLTRDKLLREAHHRAVTVDTGVPGTSCWKHDPDSEGPALFEHMAHHGLPRFASQR